MSGTTDSERTDNQNILERISELYPSLSRVQKRIADQCLSHADEVCFQSLRELAGAAGTTEATVLKFCAKVGCSGYIELKRALQERVRIRMSPNERVRMSLERIQDPNASYRRIIEGEKQSVDLTFRYMDSENFFAFVGAINSARRVFIAGHRLSRAIASFFQFRLQGAGFDAYMVDVSNVDELKNTLTHVGSEDLFVLISFPVYAKMTVALGKYLASAGIPMVSITDSPSSPIAKGAKAVLLCSTGHEIYYNSIVSAVAMVEVVCSAVVIERNERFRETQDKLKSIEEHLGMEPSLDVFTSSVLGTESDDQKE